MATVPQLQWASSFGERNWGAAQVSHPAAASLGKGRFPGRFPPGSGGKGSFPACSASSSAASSWVTKGSR